jgi:hypothetical protein
MSLRDDLSRYILAWKLCTTKRASDGPRRSGWHTRLLGVEQAMIVHPATSV